MTMAGVADVFSVMMGLCIPCLALLQESGTERESIRGGPDEDLGRGFATQAATD